MVVIREIEAGSLGDRAGFQIGDKIHRIDGHKVEDLIDFQVHSAESSLCFEVERNQEVYEVELERQPGDVFGLTFEEMRLRRCSNRCVFCFIHQMPQGMRHSLYFEDDDYRLSFLHGAYVTLTNVKEKDIDRIIEQRLSPQFISVHSTDPHLRQTMLGRRLPVDILERIEKLAGNGIEMHTQVVVCPGWNDGAHLERTVRELSAFYPAVRSVALVPVGLTKFRQNLPQLRPVTPDDAQDYVEQVGKWGDRFCQTLGERLVYAADELFILSGESPPPASYYDAFPQIENGIGMVRSFLDSWKGKKNSLPLEFSTSLHLGLVTGKLASGFLGEIVGELNRIVGLQVDMIVVENDFFGHGITVTGLLAGEDIVKKLQGGAAWDMVFLPPNCVNGDGVTLDDMTVPGMQALVGVPLAVGQYDLVDSLQGVLDGRGMAVEGSGRQLSELGYYVGKKR